MLIFITLHLHNVSYEQINTSNITFYEDEKAFRDIHKAIHTMSENIPQPQLQVEVEVEEDKKKNIPVPGIVDYESDSEKVEEMVVENRIDNDEINENSEDSIELSEKYGFYKMFWGLQEFMCTENAKRFVDCPAIMIGETGKISTTTIIIVIVFNYYYYYHCNC